MFAVDPLVFLSLCIPSYCMTVEGYELEATNFPDGI
jgi:hypothetical protein